MIAAKMNHNDFRRWLHDRLEELDRLDHHPMPDEPHWLRCSAIAHEAGDRAARLGLSHLFVRSQQFEAYSDAPPVKTFMAECLAACPRTESSPSEPATLMTAKEAIEYLRLGADERDPAERLRNLVRRQGLPVVKRGKLRLFRRAAVDAWLEKRK